MKSRFYMLWGLSILSRSLSLKQQITCKHVLLLTPLEPFRLSLACSYILGKPLHFRNKLEWCKGCQNRQGRGDKKWQRRAEICAAGEESGGEGWESEIRNLLSHRDWSHDDRSAAVTIVALYWNKHTHTHGSERWEPDQCTTQSISLRASGDAHLWSCVL